MSGTITLALRTAQSGLLTNQSALDTVANNVANVNTENYSRKKVNMEARVLSGNGAGVQIGEVTRVINEGLLKNLRTESGSFHRYDAQVHYYERMQEMFGSPGDNASLSHMISEFSQAVESLALDPDKSINQSELVRRARDMTDELQEMSTTIQDLRLQADNGIADAVTEINRLSASLGDLNDKIVRYSSSGRDVSDLKDQRDDQIDQLAELIDIRYFYRSDGDVVIFSSAGRTLVDNVPATLSHTGASSVNPTTTHAEGDLDGLYIGTKISGNDITNDVTSGKVKGFIELRDSILPNLQSQIDELSAEIRDTFNQIHNRGAAFPGGQTFTGSRNFTDPSTQRIYLDNTGSVDDVNISLFDTSGDQSATTTLNTIMTGAGLSARGGSDDWTINAIATQLQTWLQANGAATASVSASTGNFVISLNTTSVNLAFRDQTASTNGSTHSDAEINFNAGGDTNGDIDETISGFSNFLGLNDFFVDNLADNVHESNVLSSSFSSTAATITFKDSTGSLGSVAIASGKGLSDIKDLVNNANLGVTASVVPDGDGNRLRFSHNSGSSMTVTQATPTSTDLLRTLGMHVADVRTSSNIDVRSDIILTPANTASAAVQWDANKGASGEYFMSVADDTTAQQMTALMTTNNQFDASGGLAGVNDSFQEYAAAIVATNAVNADSNDANRSHQEALSDSLKLKSDTARGVNLDEEMSNLILFEQAYSAAARLITVIQDMFDALDRAVG